MDNIEQLIELLPPHLQEQLAKRIAMQHPDFLESSILTLATANYEVDMKIRVWWNSPPENEIQDIVRGKIKSEHSDHQDQLGNALLTFIKEQDIKRIGHFQELLDELQKGEA